jgi:hypothetical protein
MGNSTISLQDVMDSIAAIGDIQTVFDHTGGWADEPALTIGNDVMKELLSIRFPWKWNRLRVVPFPLNPLQQDYASLALKSLGWLENGLRIDVNNSQYPPPTWPIYAVRDLQMSNDQAGFPYQVCWFYNRDLEYGKWPGALKSYINPIGTTTPPTNGPTNILDAKGNILVLTVYGITGDAAPLAPDWTPPVDNPSALAPPNYPVGVTIQDGTCVWTVADPDAQGFRFNPMPPHGGQVWLVRLWGQVKAPTFTTLKQLIDPIPDDEEKWFRDGCVAFAHRYTSNPAAKARYTPMRAEWIAAMEVETKKNDREDESKGFFPDRSVMAPSYTTDPGPWPYRYGWR